jgi:hypothetical protein
MVDGTAKNARKYRLDQWNGLVDKLRQRKEGLSLIVVRACDGARNE